MHEEDLAHAPRGDGPDGLVARPLLVHEVHRATLALGAGEDGDPGRREWAGGGGRGGKEEGGALSGAAARPG